jgi:hypothetical protein
LRVSTKLSDVQLRLRIDENKDSLQKSETILEGLKFAINRTYWNLFSRLSRSLWSFSVFEIFVPEELAISCSSGASDLITTIAACNKSKETVVRYSNRSTHRNPSCWRLAGFLRSFLFSENSEETVLIGGKRLEVSECCNRKV